MAISQPTYPLTASALVDHVGSYADSLGGPELAYAEITTPQYGITTEVDLTGLSVTFTADGVHPVKLDAWVLASNSAGSAGLITIWLKESTTAIQGANFTIPASSGWAAIPLSRRIVPTAGSHTYKLTGVATSGTLNVWGGSGVYSYLSVTRL